MKAVVRRVAEAGNKNDAVCDETRFVVNGVSVVGGGCIRNLSMLLKSNVIVRGARPSKGDYNGRPYDNTKVYIETEIKAGERASGSVTSEYGWGSSDNYDR